MYIVSHLRMICAIFDDEKQKERLLASIFVKFTPNKEKVNTCIDFELTTI